MDNQQGNTSEVYKEHPKHNKILVSNKGNVKIKGKPRDEEPYCLPQGYRAIQASPKHTADNRARVLTVHRLVAETWLPSPEDWLIEKCSKEHHGVPLVRHLDNDILNNVPSNLDWCDLATNTRQAWEDGLIPARVGVLNGRTVLDEDTVHEMCKLFEQGYGPKYVSEVIGCSRQQASKTRAGIAWKHISKDYDIKPLVNR